MSNDGEIKVLLTADLADLKAGMDAAAEAVTASSEAMTAAIAESATSIQAAQASIGESAEAAAARIKAMVAASLEQAKADSGLAESERSLAERMGLRVEATDAQLDATAALIAAQNAQMAATEQGAAAERLEAETMEAATVATEANTEAMVINGGVARELGVMMGELARGNTARLEGSFITLGNRTGLLSRAFNFLTSPLGLVTAGAAAAGVMAFEAGEDFHQMEGAVLATGNASGYTAGMLTNLADHIAEQTGNIDQAREAVLALAESGKFAGRDLQEAAQAAVSMAQLTGQGVSQAASVIEKLREDPLRSVVALNDQFHFLTVAEYEHMQQLVATGNQIEAARVAFEAFANTMQSRSATMNDHANDLVKAYRALRVEYSQGTQELDSMLGGGDTATKLEIAQRLLKQIQGQVSTMQQTGYVGPGYVAELKAQTDVVKSLTAELANENAKVQAAASTSQAAADKIHAMGGKASKGGGDSHRGQAEADRDAFDQQRLQHNLSLSEEKQYWEGRKEAAKEGTDAYRQAVRQLLQIKDQEATAGRTAAREEVEQAKQVAAEKVRAGKEVERQNEQAAEKARQLSLEELKEANDQANHLIANKREQYELDYSEGRITAQKLLELEQELTAEKLEVDTKYYQDKQKLDAADPLEVRRDQAAIVKAKQDAESEMLRAEKTFHANSETQWKNYAKRIEGAMQGAITGMLLQHQTLRQGVANVAMVIGEDFISSAIEKPLEKWIAAEGTKLSTTIASLTGQATATETQRTANTAADIAASVASVTRAAGVAGAQGTASFSGAPWPVDMGAPAFGAAMSLAALSYASVASAAGGWERVPIDGAMTELHKDEMVLPAHIANPMRQMVKQGGQGGGDHYHISAMDMRSFSDAARRNERTFATVIKRAARNGHFNGRR